MIRAVQATRDSSAEERRQTATSPRTPPSPQHAPHPARIATQASLLPKRPGRWPVLSLLLHNCERGSKEKSTSAMKSQGLGGASQVPLVGAASCLATSAPPRVV